MICLVVLHGPLIKIVAHFVTNEIQPLHNNQGMGIDNFSAKIEQLETVHADILVFEDPVFD